MFKYFFKIRFISLRNKNGQSNNEEENTIIYSTFSIDTKCIQYGYGVLRRGYITGYLKFVKAAGTLSFNGTTKQLPKLKCGANLMGDMDPCGY